jgi:prepilin-type N-terminal cleavage/methylation domain-containing protein
MHSHSGYDVQTAQWLYSGMQQKLQARLRDDSGLTLIELIVSMVVFSIAAAGIAGGFMAAVKTSGNDRGRIAAANLAQREVEIVRNTFNGTESGPATVIAAGSAVNPNPLPGGTAGQALVIDGRPYTVNRSLSWLTADTGASPCDGGSATAHPKLALTVTVTWPSMGTIDPVEARTILTPPLGVLNSNTNFIAVKVIDSSGVANEGVQVNLIRNSTGTISTVSTEADGCGVFATTNTGSHTVSLDMVGHVDINGEQLTSKAININASSFQRVDFSYDQEATLQVQLTTDAGHDIPSGVNSVTLASTGFTTGRRTFPAASAGVNQVGDLWPISSGYEVWAGSCEQSDPAASGGTRPAPVLIDPGATSPTFQARLTPVEILVSEADGDPVAGSAMVAVPVSTATCAASELTLSLGTSGADGTIKTSLPGGSWTIRPATTAYPTASSWPETSVLLPTSPLQSIDVEVNS